MKVAAPHRDRVYFHAGYGNRFGIPYGDIARVEEALDTIVSDYMMNCLLTQLDRCDKSFQETETGNANRYDTKELYTGDISRAIIRDSSSKGSRAYWDAYYKEVGELCQLLWIADYRSEENLRYRFARDGGVFMDAVPGIADTSVASRIVERKALGGSFGF